MCGIAGILRRGAPQSVDRAELSIMIETLRHRGPDGYGYFVTPECGLAHARLSIIDLSTGDQPIHNEDRTVWVAFNGEIFNYIELRRGLQGRGHRFYTQSDTEVIVHLYEEHGERFVEHLNGQFAIALWDLRQQRLVLARDRVGIRPLFHANVRGRFVFASEIKALFALPEVPRRLDPLGLAQVFSYWSCQPPTTVFEGIEALPPGHVLSIDAQGRRLQRYWDWSFPDEPVRATGSIGELAEELRALLVDAVRLQLRADVPVGAYLSGGLDSSIIAGLIRHYTDTPLRTFSVTFDDPEFDESAHQEAMVRHLGTEHSSIVCRPQDIAAAFPQVVWHAESPLLRTAPTPLMLLSRLVHESGYKVVLTGEGADEVFGGYDLFKEAKVRRFWGRYPQSRLRPRALERLYPYLRHSPASSRAFSRGFFGEGLEHMDRPWFAHRPRWTTTQRSWQFFAPELRSVLAAWDPLRACEQMLPEGAGRWPVLGRDQYIEAHTLLSGYLLSSQGDRMAMASSIEARFPFLDHRVIEFANRLPPRLKIRGLDEKYLLKASAAGLVAESTRRRSKQPYRAPDSASFFGGGVARDYVAELLGEASIRAAGYFDARAVQSLVDKCAAGRAIGFADNMAFVGVLSTMLLHESLVVRRGTAPRAGRPEAPLQVA